MSSYFVHNFGCRATQADGAALERRLLASGMQCAEDAQGADVVVLNSCTVTASADRDVRAAIRRIHRENPECRILVTGCYAQRAPEELTNLPGVSWVVGNSHKHQVADLLSTSCIDSASTGSLVPLQTLRRSPDHPIATHPMVLVGDIFAHTELLAAPVFEARTHSEKTRPNLKVQDGCDNRCSFCVIPSVRGQSRSLPRAEVLREVRGLVDAGYREVVISGINLGRWGRDFAAEERFEDLVRAILRETPLERLRLSSVEPMDWSDELIGLMAESPRIAKHVHAPLQSGSDRILRAMHRKYRPWHYEARMRKVRQQLPLAAIGADVMVGFPGETDELFEESRAFIASLPFTYLHVFTFSARPGTPAATLPKQIPVHIARERNRMLRELAEEKNRAFRESLLGQTLDAITLSAGDDGSTEAITDNYLPLRIRGEHLSNQWMRVEIDGLAGNGLLGSPVL